MPTLIFHFSWTWQSSLFSLRFWKLVNT